MNRYGSGALTLITAYLIASAAYLCFIRWPDWEGHAHVPFSNFPGFLVWAPVAPYFMLTDWLATPGQSLPGILVFAGTFAVVCLALLMRRKHTARQS